MGALEAPQDRHGQEHRTGTSRAEQTDKGDHGGAGSSGGHGGAGSSGDHGVARGSGGHGSARELRGHGRWSLWLWPRSPRPGPYSRNPFNPPKISLGKLGGIRSPPRLDRQDKTGTRQPTGTGSPPGLSLEAEASSGHDEVSGALTGSLSNRFHLSDKGAGGWERPPWPLNKEPPAPDESPWTRQGKFKMFLRAQQDNTALLAVTCGLDPRG